MLQKTLKEGDHRGYPYQKILDLAGDAFGKEHQEALEGLVATGEMATGEMVMGGMATEESDTRIERAFS